MKNKLRIGKEELIIFLTIGLAYILYYFHWKFGLPLHPNVDETITINAVRQLLEGNSLLIQVFNYPHLPFYWGGFWCKVVSIFANSADMVLVLRCAECGFALLTNVCIYFSIKELTGSKKWGYIGLVIALFSLYQAQYLYYAGPDVMLYGMSNITFYLGIKAYKEENIKKVFRKWYPLIAISIGLSISAKYHGILWGVYWLMIHILKKYARRLEYNVCFALNCFWIIITWLICNISVLFYINDFFSGILGIKTNYTTNTNHTAPFLGYLETFFFHNFGLIGLLLFIFGTVYLLKKEEYRRIAAAVLILDVLVLIILGSFKMMFGRNLSLIMPCTYFFITFGLYSLEQAARSKHQKILVNILLVFMIGANISALFISESYTDSYQAVEKWIEENLPEGSTLCYERKGSWYLPAIDWDKYTGKLFELDEIPDKLGSNEYYIAIEYGDSRYVQKKDYPILFGDEYAKPDWAETYLNATKNYKKIASFPGITYEHGWRYRIGYFDIFRYDKSEYFIGPTIEIYSY